jgi:hypothetical protein
MFESSFFKQPLEKLADREIKAKLDKALKRLIYETQISCHVMKMFAYFKHLVKGFLKIERVPE